jgi:hypothetical protein
LESFQAYKKNLEENGDPLFGQKNSKKLKQKKAERAAFESQFKDLE